MKSFKNCFYIILFLSIYLNCFAQDLTVSLSVEWTKKIDSEINRFRTHYKIDSIPQLIVSYQNNSDKDLYMLKAMTAENYHPYIGIEWIRGEIVSSKYLESQEPTFGFIMRKGSSKNWKMAGIRCLSDKNHKNNEKLEKLFNGIMKYKLADFKNSYMFFPNELLLSAIPKNDNGDFVFLRKGSVVRDSYSLIGLYLIGGSFKFYLRSNMFSETVFARPQNLAPRMWRKAKTTFDGTTIRLPNWIDTYQLYADKCKSDTLFIIIDYPSLSGKAGVH